LQSPEICSKSVFAQAIMVIPAKINPIYTRRHVIGGNINNFWAVESAYCLWHTLQIVWASFQIPTSKKMDGTGDNEREIGF
jgi:hypothetical protein